MKDLIEELKKENKIILLRNPKVATEFDWSSDAYKLQHNEEMISKLSLLNTPTVINWVTIKSNVRPNENVEECLVKYNNGQVRTALFSQEDNRFYNSINDQDISDNIQAYAELPN